MSLGGVGPHLIVDPNAESTDVAAVLWERILPKVMRLLVITEYALPLCTDPEVTVAVVYDLVYRRLDAGKKGRELLGTAIERRVETKGSELRRGL